MTGEVEDVTALRRWRDHLINQIRESERTIERSKELIRQVDELFAKLDTRLARRQEDAPLSLTPPDSKTSP
jgi:hypothetical protein